MNGLDFDQMKIKDKSCKNCFWNLSTNPDHIICTQTCEAEGECDIEKHWEEKY